jgi:hypothetical protein
VIGLNAQCEEVVTYDLASRMVDLEVELAPELTKGSHTSASISAFFQATRVITTRDALEEFVAADIWPCKPRWGTWAFSMKQLPGLDHDICSPKFNVKRPEGRTDDEILADVERKVIQMIGNYTHKEWECAQKILKHSGRVNRLLEEMNSKKGKVGKTTVAMEGTSKVAKATEVLAQRKAEAAKTTLPPLTEKSTKLMKCPPPKKKRRRFMMRHQPVT